LTSCEVKVLFVFGRPADKGMFSRALARAPTMEPGPRTSQTAGSGHRRRTRAGRLRHRRGV